MSNVTLVSPDDQLLINKFARFFQQQSTLKAEIKELENEIANLGEAGDEILLLDDEDSRSVPLRIGSSFIHFDSDSLGTRLETMKGKAEVTLSEKKAKCEEITEEMGRIRTILYGKFGDKINLETDRDD